MYNAMDLSDIQVLSPSRSRTHKAFFQNNIYSHSNYRTNKRRNFIDMDILDYPSFGSYFCIVSISQVRSQIFDCIRFLFKIYNIAPFITENS